MLKRTRTSAKTKTWYSWWLRLETFKLVWAVTSPLRKMTSKRRFLPTKLMRTVMTSMTVKVALLATLEMTHIVLWPVWKTQHSTFLMRLPRVSRKRKLWRKLKSQRSLLKILRKRTLFLRVLRSRVKNESKLKLEISRNPTCLSLKTLWVYVIFHSHG